MAPIQIKKGDDEREKHDREGFKINPADSFDNLSVTSVTRKISKIFEGNPIELNSSREDTFDVSSLYPSGKFNLKILFCYYN